MNFGDDPEAFTTANDMLIEISDYLKVVEPYNQGNKWSILDFSNYYDSHGAQKYPFDTVVYNFPRNSTQDWEKLIKMYSSLMDNLKTFITQLKEYDMDDENISQEDRDAHCCVFEDVITEMMCHSGLVGMLFLTQKFKEPWSSDVELREKYLCMLFNGHQLSIQAAVVLTQRLGYIGKNFGNWILCNLIIFTDHQTRYNSPYYDESYPIVGYNVLMQDRTLDNNDEFVNVTIEQLDNTYKVEDSNVPKIIQNTIYNIPFQTWFGLISNNIRHMLVFVRGAGGAYLYHVLRDLFKNLQYMTENNASKDDLTQRRKEIFTLSDLIYKFLELVSTTIKHPYQPTWILVGHLTCLLTWAISYCAMTEIKQNGSIGTYNLEDYATRSAKLHAWIVHVMRNSTQPPSFMRGYYANFVKPGYEFVLRNVALHTKGKEIIDKEVYEILHEHASNPNSGIDWVPTPMAKVKPSPAMIIKFPEWSKLESLKTLNIWNDANIIREWFDIKLKQYDNKYNCVTVGNNDDNTDNQDRGVEYNDVISEFNDEIDLNNRPSLLPYIQQEDKRQVEISSLMGRVRWVNSGNDWDYRVKIVKSQPDLVVEYVNVDSLANKPGKWRKVDAGRTDFKLKLVHTGVYDFSIMFK